MGVVYEAFDQSRGMRVALKTLRRLDAVALYRFKQEFRTLADVSHSNLVALYELVSSQSGWFFTMELVEGSNFLAWVRSGAQPSRDAARIALPSIPVVVEEPSDTTTVRMGHDTAADTSIPTMPLGDEAIAADVAPMPAVFALPDISRLRSSLAQLAEGIVALHGAGKLHRDIKPSNVLVTGDGRVVLLDFGLATEFVAHEGNTTSVGRIVGTIAYMSPEQCAGRAATTESDWYSVGVMLYEALVGRLPHTGAAVRVLGKKQRQDPIAPRRILATVPKDLDELCMSLLSRDPAQRPSGDQVLRMLGRGRSMMMSGMFGRGAAGQPTELIGRETHLAALHDALSGTARGSPITVYVHGSSGMGKTALVQRFLEQVAAEGSALVVRGRAYEREMVPYKAFDSLVDELTRYLARLDAQVLEAVLPRDIWALARLFPVLLRVPSLEDAPRPVMGALSPVMLRRRAFLALLQMLANLAQWQQVVLHIDDLQWGDADSASLLTEVLRPPGAPPILLVACYRTEDARSSALLRALLSSGPRIEDGSDVREIVVQPLSYADALELALSLLESDEGDRSSPEVRDQAAAIAFEAKGSPFLISELARWVRRQRASLDDASPLSVRKPRISGAEVTLEMVIDDRLSRLPEGTRRLLEIVAVAARPVEESVLAHATRLGTRLQEAIAALRSARLVRTSSRDGQEIVETYHDRIRDVLVSRLDAVALRERHIRLAEGYEAIRGADPESLALHFAAAADPVRTARYAELAADRAAAALAFEHAARLYQLVLKRSPPNTPNSRRVLARLADTLANAGRGVDAARAYLEAASGTLAAERLELERRAAEQLLRSGHVDEGLDVMQRVLDAIGMQMAPSPRRALASMVASRARLSLRGLHYRERDEAQVHPDDLTRIDVTWAVASGLSGVDAIHATHFQSRHILLALKAGEPYRVARALLGEATIQAAAGAANARRVRKLLDQAREIGQRIDNLHVIGLSATAAGGTSFMQGQWKTATEWCDRAEAILADLCTGAAWELVSAQIFGLRARFFLGELAVIARRVPELLQVAEERGDLYASANLRHGYLNMAWLLSGQVDAARRQAREGMRRWSNRGFHVQHFSALLAEADVDLYEGLGDRAYGLVLDSWPAIQDSLLTRVQYIRIEALFLRARATLASAAAGTTPRQMLARAEADAKAIAKEKTAWGDPLAALLSACTATLHGDSARAIALFGQAEDGFVEAGMALHAVVARRRLGRLIGGSTGTNMVEESESWLRSQGVREPDRLTEVLAPGAAARSLPAPRG